MPRARAPRPDLPPVWKDVLQPSRPGVLHRARAFQQSADFLELVAQYDARLVSAPASSNHRKWPFVNWTAAEWLKITAENYKEKLPEVIYANDVGRAHLSTLDIKAAELYALCPAERYRAGNIIPETAHHGPGAIDENGDLLFMFVTRGDPSTCTDSFAYYFVGDEHPLQFWNDVRRRQFSQTQSDQPVIADVLPTCRNARFNQIPAAVEPLSKVRRAALAEDRLSAQTVKRTLRQGDADDASRSPVTSRSKKPRQDDATSMPSRSRANSISEPDVRLSTTCRSASRAKARQPTPNPMHRATLGARSFDTVDAAWLVRVIGRSKQEGDACVQTAQDLLDCTQQLRAVIERARDAHATPDTLDDFYLVEELAEELRGLNERVVESAAFFGEELATLLDEHCGPASSVKDVVRRSWLNVDPRSARGQHAAVPRRREQLQRSARQLGERTSEEIQDRVFNYLHVEGEGCSEDSPRGPREWK